MSVSRPANPPLPSLWTVRGKRTAALRTPREARSRTAMTERLRPPTRPAARPVGRQRVGLGRGTTGHAGRTRDRDEGTVAVDELLTQSGKCGALLGDRRRPGGGGGGGLLGGPGACT